MPNVLRALWVGSLIALVAAATGCRSNGEEAKTVTVQQKVIVEKPAAPKKHRRTGRTAPAQLDFVYCDSNIQAKVGTTTCPFAENVFWTYWTSGESTSLDVWSPAAQSSFATTCNSDAVQVVCTTSDNAAVKFSQGALDRYSDAQANAYADSHDLGPVADEGVPDSGGDDCQGYDPCITPGDDVDCASGSGNGPRYVDGPVYVTGSDPYDLDRDGDGVACE
jgi:hypothetical protein